MSSNPFEKKRVHEIVTEDEAMPIVLEANADYVRGALGGEITTDWRKVNVILRKNRTIYENKYGPLNGLIDNGRLIGLCLEKAARCGLLLRLTDPDKDRPNGGNLYRISRAAEVMDAGCPPEQIIPIDKIKPPMHMLRRNVGDTSELMQSIRDEGLLAPILVRPSPTSKGCYEVVDGHRRFQACTNLGTVKKVGCIIRPLDDRAVIIAGLTENIARKNMSPVEIGEALLYLFKHGWFTVGQMGRRLGKSDEWIRAHIGIMSYPPEVQRRIHDGRLPFTGAAILQKKIDNGKLTLDVVLRILSLAQEKGLSSEDAVEIAEEVEGSKGKTSPEDAAERVVREKKETLLGMMPDGIEILANKKQTHFSCPKCKTEFDLDPEKRVVYIRQTKIPEFVPQAMK